MNLNLTMKQTQTLSPQMVQAMKILQMGAQELLEYVEEAMQENPVLEATEPSSQQADEYSLLRKQLEWLDKSDRREGYSRQQEDDGESDPLSNYGGAEGEEENLYHYVLSQLQALDLPQGLMAAARCLVESLNGNGYLDEPLIELAQEFQAPLCQMERALQVVQSLEPAGIGARNLSECLCLQLDRHEAGTPLARRIATEQLDALSKSRYNLIAKELNAPLEQVRAACELIRSLNPKPGTGFAGRERVSYITPDLFVLAFPDHFELVTNHYFFPNIRLSSYYRSLLSETQDTEVKEYLTDKIRQAKWVVKSVEQRRSTLMSCAECILESQEEFFRRGPGHLVPMCLSDIAAKLGVHESTVSRAIKDKYIQCNHGVYPLNYFLSRGLGHCEGGDAAATPDAAKALLKRLVSEEDRKKPLSDQKLCQIMGERGCPLSRRTVAKYRDELGIPCTAGRREYE